MREGLADVLPARAPGTTESRLRFVHAADAARSRLVLVRRAVDDEGRELAPSPYWLEACRVAGRPFDELDRAPGARGEVPDAAAAARSERDALRAMALDGEVAPGLLEEAAARRTRPVGVGPDAFRDRARLRVTELEAFLRCPYGWFRDSYLSPAEMEELIDPRFEGNLAHAVLQRTYERHARRRGPARASRPPSTATGRRSRPRCPRSCAAARPAGAGAAYEALEERLRRHLRAMLGREAALASALVPTALRARHGERAARRPRGAGRGGDRDGQPPRRLARREGGARGRLQALRRRLRGGERRRHEAAAAAALRDPGRARPSGPSRPAGSTWGSCRRGSPARSATTSPARRSPPG